MKLEVERRDYSGHPLDEAAISADPLEQFHAWFADAVAAKAAGPDAMALATATADGVPSVRMVLLKEASERGFVWYTNYGSRKADELAANPRAALLFYWEAVHRQVRVEGTVERVDADESDAYFASRPRSANLSSMASAQSQPISGRAFLEAEVAALDARWQGRELERPAGWGGFRLVPQAYEFWQGREDRLHDRVRYERVEAGWRRVRLAP